MSKEELGELIKMLDKFYKHVAADADDWAYPDVHKQALENIRRVQMDAFTSEPDLASTPVYK